MDSILNCSLFKGISSQEIQAMLKCLNAHKKTFLKGACIYHAGDTAASLGLLLSGSVQLIRQDLWGNQQIIAHIAPGEIFAEAYACVGTAPFSFDVTAAEASEILFLNVKRVVTTCSSCCSFHSRLIQNLLFTLASKNMFLTKKMEHITPKSIRDRVLAYLSDEAGSRGASTFTLPFNRQQMADYLCVDRSALSGELSKMQKEGLISYKKNVFSLLISPLP